MTEQLNLARLMDLPEGTKRRNVHDDVTVLVIFFNDEAVPAAKGSAGPVPPPRSLVNLYHLSAYDTIQHLF